MRKSVLDNVSSFGWGGYLPRLYQGSSAGRKPSPSVQLSIFSFSDMVSRFLSVSLSYHCFQDNIPADVCRPFSSKTSRYFTQTETKLRIFRLNVQVQGSVSGSGGKN